MAEFKDISEFSLKPILDGQEEIQISAENKTTLLQIAKLVLTNLFTLDNFQESPKGFGPLISTDTLMQALKKINLGFSNGKARIFASDVTGNLIMGLATEKGIIGFDLQNQDIEIYFDESVTEPFSSKSDDDLAEQLDNSGEIWNLKNFVQEHLYNIVPSGGLLNVNGSNIIWVTNQVTQINLTAFESGYTSAVIGGLTQTIAPTLKAVSSGMKIYKASNWDSIWAMTGMKVITIQRFSPTSKILVANVGLYLEA